MEQLPTIWTNRERDLLIGTTLKAATEAKLRALYREFDNLRKCTSHISWCNSIWWDEADGMLDFDDWKQVDAMYRSRALEFPGIGDAMVPCVDMANHASGDQTAALYEKDVHGNALLYVRQGRNLETGEEVTIT
jgi:hypothetical protein